MSSPSLVLRCSKCGLVKPTDDFDPDKSHKFRGYRYWCKECRREHYRRPGTANAASQRYRERYPERVARTKLKNRIKRHGMTLEQYDAMLVAQDGHCVTCANPLEGGRKTHLDHCHATGVVRAILCDTCNRALGYAQDDPVILRAMADYIEHHRARSPAG